jgi:hypothetical protein
MGILKSDFVARVKRLPEPKNEAQALQPFFEAIMNSIHSAQDKFSSEVKEKGRIYITIEGIKKCKDIKIIIEDNGVGLDKKNYDAFLTTDTENKKKQRGGKGVGRLLLLACFNDIGFESRYLEEDLTNSRKFKFILSNENQIIEEELNQDLQAKTGLIATFQGLKIDYENNFSKTEDSLFKNIMAHFLPILISQHCPNMTIEIDQNNCELPKDIEKYIHRKEEVAVEYKEKSFTLTMLDCDSSLNNDHSIYFIAHDRTVQCQSIKNKLGFGPFETKGQKRAFQGVITGHYLDSHVNQERTQFTFDTTEIGAIVTECIEKIQEFLKEPVEEHKAEQEKVLLEVLDQYPSLNFDSKEKLLEHITTKKKPEDIYTALSLWRHRADKKNYDVINAIINTELGENETFDEKLTQAVDNLELSSKNSLAEYMLKRKMILNILDKLINRISYTDKDKDYHLENTLHGMLCPTQVTTVRAGRSEGEEKVEPVDPISHNLWVIDERLSYSNLISSDTPFKKIIASSESAGRSDLIVFDRAFSFRDGKSPHVLIIELKRPGRKEYKEVKDNPILQIEKYVEELKKVDYLDINGRAVKLPSGVRFHCFLIADIRGDLIDLMGGFKTTADGSGKIRDLKEGINGFIQIIEWNDLLESAEARHKSFFEKLRIPTA